MFHGRPGWMRTAAGAVVGASCLAATACGGLTAATLRASSVADPLAGQPGSKVMSEATANAEAAASLTINGTVTQSGKSITIDLGIKRGQGCAGTVGVSGVGSMKLVLIGKTLYMKPDTEFWKSVAGSDSNASAVIALLGDRYLKLPANDGSAAGIGDVCDVSKLLNSGATPGRATREPVSRLGGIRVLPLKLSDGSTEYVTDTSKPEFVEAFAPKGTHGGAGQARLSVGAPVRLTAPPPSQVIDGSKLGMTGSSVPSFI
jgi:hypothetical protein